MSDTTTNIGLAGRETTPLVRVMLVLTGGAAAFIGLILYVGSAITDTTFAWPVGSPVTSVLLGAGLLGAVPMLWWSATRVLWEQIRVATAASALVIVGMAWVTVSNLGHTSAGGGDIVPYALALAWVAGVSLLALGTLIAIMVQFREPALPLERTAPIPRWSAPLVGLEGAALLILCGAMVIEPDFWGPLVPWQTTAFDVQMIGVWGAALGITLLGALAEDDLVRVKPGLLGAISIGGLALIGMGWRSGEVRWSGWPATITVTLLGGMFAVGVVGWLLAGRAGRAAPPTD